VVKPTLVKGFDYKAMAWADLAEVNDAVPLVPANAGTLEPAI
jgi:hypothetical protein